MKKNLMICAIALLAIATACAQDARGKRGRGPGMEPQQMVERRVNMLDKELTLTAEQKAAITAIYTDEQQAMQSEMEQMRHERKDDTKERPDQEAMKARHEAMKTRQADIDAKVAALLTPEQKEKFDQLKQNRGNGGPGRHHGRPGHGPKDKKGQPRDADTSAKADCCKDACQAEKNQ